MAEEHYNLDELVPPSFMDEAYIVNVLRQVEDNPDLHVINYEIKPGSKAGDHYASIMFKIIATYGTRGKVVNERRFILKTVPEAEGQKKDLLEQLPAFKNEIAMYTKVLKDMEKILEENGEEGWWPKLVYSTAKPFVLIFDDLTMDNYEVVYDPLDFDNIGLIVEKIAKYHALSLVLIDRGHTEVKDYRMVFTEEMKQMFAPMSRVMLQLVDDMKTWPGYEEIGDKIEKFVPTMVDKMFKLMTKDVSHYFNVLNHGDFHIRNLMFKRSADGKLSDVIFLDFQMPNYNVPCYDFFGLMTSMCTEEVRKREDEVIKMYHRFLSSNLKAFGFKADIPTVIDIHVALLRMIEYRVFYTFVMGPMFRLRGFELGALFTPDSNQEIVKALGVIFKDPLFIEDIKLALDRYDSLGIFDM